MQRLPDAALGSWTDPRHVVWATVSPSSGSVPPNLTLTTSSPSSLMTWTCSPSSGAASGIANEATASVTAPLSVFFALVAGMYQAPVSVAPAGSVPPTGHGEPVLPLHA